MSNRVSLCISCPQGVQRTPPCLLGSPLRSLCRQRSTISSVSHWVRGRSLSLWVSPHPTISSMSPWVSPSNDILHVSVGLPFALLPSEVQRFPPCLLGSPLRSLTVRGLTIFFMFPWVSPSKDLLHVSLGLPFQRPPPCLLGFPLPMISSMFPRVSPSNDLLHVS